MWTAGTCGLAMCATRLMPVAKKLGLSSAPLIDLANSGANWPNTVEVLTPTFSNTRPVISPMTPPPPGAPVASGRSHGVRTKRPGGSGAGGFVLDRLEGGAELVAERLEPRLRGELLVVEGRGVGHRRCLAQRPAGAKPGMMAALGGKRTFRRQVHEPSPR